MPVVNLPNVNPSEVVSSNVRVIRCNLDDYRGVTIFFNEAAAIYKGTRVFNYNNFNPYDYAQVCSLEVRPSPDSSLVYINNTVKADAVKYFNLQKYKAIRFGVVSTSENAKPLLNIQARGEQLYQFVFYSRT
jgi:hypothetical protein